MLYPLIHKPSRSRCTRPSVPFKESSLTGFSLGGSFRHLSEWFASRRLQVAAHVPTAEDTARNRMNALDGLFQQTLLTTVFRLTALSPRSCQETLFLDPELHKHLEGTHQLACLPWPESFKRTFTYPLYWYFGRLGAITGILPNLTMLIRFQPAYSVGWLQQRLSKRKSPVAAFCPFKRLRSRVGSASHPLLHGLAAVSHVHPIYPRWTVPPATGLGCHHRSFGPNPLDRLNGHPHRSTHISSSRCSRPPCRGHSGLPAINVPSVRVLRQDFRPKVPRLKRSAPTGPFYKAFGPNAHRRLTGVWRAGEGSAISTLRLRYYARCGLIELLAVSLNDASAGPTWVSARICGRGYARLRNGQVQLRSLHLLFFYRARGLAKELYWYPARACNERGVGYIFALTSKKNLPFAKAQRADAVQHLASVRRATSRGGLFNPQPAANLAHFKMPD